MKKLMFVLCVTALTAVVSASPYMSAIPTTDWDKLLAPGFEENAVDFLTPAEGGDYLNMWQMSPILEGEPYLPLGEPVMWVEPQLYLFGGDTSTPDYPDEPGLVMQWEKDDAPDNSSAGWELIYGVDPDLTNCTINISVYPPQWINVVSFWLTDINGNQVAWKWNVGAGPPLSYNFTTAIQIDTSKLPLGMNSTTPPANGFTPGLTPGAFDITKVISFGVSENAFMYPGNIVPPNGQPTTGQAWNAWSNLWVIKNDTKTYKGNYVKFSQPPEVISEELPPQIYGWDVKSVFPENYDQGLVWTWAADDWKCYDERPITDVHWWGSFIGWTQPHLPPRVPDYFIMAIWRDVLADSSTYPPTPSHPQELLWQHKCYKWVSNFAGYDVDPRAMFLDDNGTPDEFYNLDLLGLPQESESCFQFNQLLDEEDWFYQDPMDDPEMGNTYWFSIAAVYEGLTQGEVIQYPWGWKTKPFKPDKAPDAAVVIQGVDAATGGMPWDTVSNPSPGGHVTQVVSWFPLLLPDPGDYPNGDWFDLAFELTTNEPPCPGLSADLNDDCIVNLPDFAIMAGEWLMTSP